MSEQSIFLKELTEKKNVEGEIREKTSFEEESTRKYSRSFVIYVVLLEFNHQSVTCSCKNREKGKSEGLL